MMDSAPIECFVVTNRDSPTNSHPERGDFKLLAFTLVLKKN